MDYAPTQNISSTVSSLQNESQSRACSSVSYRGLALQHKVVCTCTVFPSEKHPYYYKIKAIKTDNRIPSVKAYLHAAICRADLSAMRNREANRRVCFGLCGRD